MEDCVFCKIINKEVPAEVLFEDEKAVVFKDVNPQAPVHYLVVPKKHIRSLNEMKDDEKELMSHLIFTAREAAEIVGVKKKGYKLAIHTEKGGGQEVFHLHLHLIAK